MRRHRHRGGFARVRTRHRADDGAWHVRGRVERFGEPALLLLLRERPAHGYELVERLGELLSGERIDMGNLYRVLRALEEEGVVSSEWSDEVPGPAKRTYELTEAGRALLDSWAEALRETQGALADFLTRYEDGRR
jgi:poly-beta-hydroxybutyrate-responsive repressor